MECTDKEKTLKVLDTLKELMSDDSGSSVKMASLEETQKFQPIPQLSFGEKLRYKGTASLRFPKKDEEVFVYSVDVPLASPESDSRAISRNDFTFIVIFGDGKLREFSADSRHFERVE